MVPLHVSIVALLLVMLSSPALGLIFDNQQRYQQQGTVDELPALDMFQQDWQQPQPGTLIPPQGQVQWPSQEEDVQMVQQQQQQLLWQPDSQQIPFAQSSDLLQEDRDRPHQRRFRGFSGRQPGFFRRSVGSPYMQRSSDQNPSMLYGENDQGSASLQRSVLTLEAQLAAERKSASLLANVASARQQEMLRVNASFARILNLAETGAGQEKQLQKQLSNVTAINTALRAELALVRIQETQKAKELIATQAEVAKEVEVARLKSEAAEERAKTGEVLEQRALHVMKEVQDAQKKVQRTEDIIRTLLPRLAPNLKPSGAAGMVP